MLDRLLAKARARPIATTAAVTALTALAWTGGWVAGHAQNRAGEVALTSQKILPVSLPKPAPPPAPEGLQSRLEELAERYRDPVGIAVMDLDKGWIAQVDGERPYPQQSVSKLWVAISTLEAVDRGESDLEREVTLGPDDRSVFYQPLGRRIRASGGPTVSIRELLRWAITKSDNSANDKLIRELGGADEVKRILAEKGLSHLRVGAAERDLQARTAGMTWRPEYGIDWNFQHARERLPDAVRDAAMDAYLADPPDGASPVGIVQALAQLHRGKLLSPASTEVMLDLLADTTTGAMRLKAGLPEGFKLAHKTGTGQDWRGFSVGINDVGLITAPDGRVYAIAVMMEKTHHRVPARLAFMQAVSRAVAEHWRESRGELPAGQTIARSQAATENGL